MADAPTRIDRILTPVVRDILLPVGLIVLDWTSLAARPAFLGGGPRPEPPSGPNPSPPHGVTAGPAAYVLVACTFLPLALRRRFPLAVLALTTVAAAVYQVLHLPPSIVFTAPLIALYTIGTLRDRRTLLVAGVLAAGVTLGVSLPAWGATTFWSEALRIVSTFGVAAALGDATRNRRAYVAEVERRAVEAEETREEEAARRVDEERLRIARELHDVTAHSLSIIAVQSGAAAHVIDTDPAAARRALDAIRRTSKDALDELRAMLGVLRAPGDTDAPLAPVPGLVRISELVDPLAAAGYEVALDIDDDLGDMPTVVELSAYRIVQESLTNVVRHAGVCAVAVTLRREDDTLMIAVDDDGRSERVTSAVAGHGIEGMRERVTALGGVFEATPLPGGGFHVGARLPLGSRSASWQK
jgi:signal transduction histidine kinase